MTSEPCCIYMPLFVYYAIQFCQKLIQFLPVMDVQLFVFLSEIIFYRAN